MQELNYFIVFIEGLLSVFSPCVLPIIPIYMSVLSNSSISDMNNSKYSRKTLVINTLFFALGISATFFILGKATNSLGNVFNSYKDMIMLFGGIIIIIMGLFYVGIINLNVLNKEKRFNLEAKTMSPISAFLLGFAFSFGWTPCIGPILASVLIMSSTASSSLASTVLIAVYTLGFILPFIIVAIFYSKLYEKLNILKKHMSIIKKVCGVIIIIAGAIMLFNGVISINNKISLNNSINQSLVNKEESTNDEDAEELDNTDKSDSNNNEINNNSDDTDNNESNSDGTSKDNQEITTTEEDEDKLPPIDFTLLDQYGVSHTLSDYKGKTVFLNFWATWCGPCRNEMPDIEELYSEYNYNNDEIVILGVASPNIGSEGDQDSIVEFLTDNEYTFPVVFDEGGTMLMQYGLNSFPSTLIISEDGYVEAYIPGAMDKKTMKSLIEQVQGK